MFNTLHEQAVKVSPACELLGNAAEASLRAVYDHEAHIEELEARLEPELPEGKAVTINPATDIAALCANCHRMIN